VTLRDLDIDFHEALIPPCFKDNIRQAAQLT
jgi:hypothetical protein